MKKVAIIDSGSGGCNVLAQCLKICPCFDYFLFIDDENLPYGEKSKKELEKIAIENITFLKKIFSPEIVVVACNTLTAVCMAKLKKMFPEIRFVGCDPKIKQAKSKFLDDEILVLATPVTFRNNQNLKTFHGDKVCERYLPKIIDENLFNREKILETLRNMLPQKKYKGIVLGCTHYEGIKKELFQIYGAVDFFSCGEDIAKLLKNDSYNQGYNLQIKTSSGENIGYFFKYLMSLIH